tara:strand:- start:2747 stop:2953 length:207 start_codon:yes stop_codon:yes gene_type:complete
MKDTKTNFDNPIVQKRIKKLNELLETDVKLYNHLTRNGYIEYILNGDNFPYKEDKLVFNSKLFDKPDF